VNRIASKSWLDDEMLRQLIAKTSAEFERKRLDMETPKSTKSKSIWRRRLQGDSSYIRHVVGKLKHWQRLKYKLADLSAGQLSTPETWARDTSHCTRRFERRYVQIQCNTGSYSQTFFLAQSDSGTHWQLKSANYVLIHSSLIWIAFSSAHQLTPLFLSEWQFLLCVEEAMQ